MADLESRGRAAEEFGVALSQELREMAPEIAKSVGMKPLEQRRFLEQASAAAKPAAKAKPATKSRCGFDDPDGMDPMHEDED